MTSRRRYSFRVERRVTLKPTSGSEGHLSHCVKSSEDQSSALLPSSRPHLPSHPKVGEGVPPPEAEGDKASPLCCVFSPGTASDGALYLRYQALEHREEMGANCRYAEALASLALPALHGLFPGAAAAAAAGAKDAPLC
ncbi:hypothetical protein HPB47_016752 [Ixodes persulcatus]|uniref:Uncharacterized protein n=1 Tax=Ixodes persulcatus TaxID=34615 RepID=A0AC60QS55_IXOPE|nr:hypothetical protein HPB47_016752 [Ixodes persulcatus]